MSGKTACVAVVVLLVTFVPAARHAAANATPCASVAASVNPPTDTAPGITVTITATATGCASPRYEFWVLYPGTTRWLAARYYSLLDSFDWDTSSKPAGTYRFAVWAEDASSIGTQSNVLGSWDSYTMLTYALQGWNPNPCTSASISPLFPPSPNALITIYSHAFGCATPRFAFWISRPTQPGGWPAQPYRLVQAYSPVSTFVWDPTGSPPGTYSVMVWVRDATSAGVGSTPLGTWDAYATDPLPSGSGCSLVNNATFSPTGSSPRGTVVTVTATAHGCPDPNPEYEFWILPAGVQTWQLAQAYSTSSTFIWDTHGQFSGTYRFSIWIRDTASLGVNHTALGDWDASTMTSYAVLDPNCKSIAATAAPVSPVVAGTRVSIAASATFCPDPTYEFWVRPPGAGMYTPVQFYLSGSTYDWDTTNATAGTYHWLVFTRNTFELGRYANQYTNWDVYAAFTYTIT